MCIRDRSGSKVEGYEKLDADLEKIVVGKILSIEKHPDADKLIICQVDAGEKEPIQIVTGASNVREGDVVPVVLPGGRVAGGHDGSKTEGEMCIRDSIYCYYGNWSGRNYRGCIQFRC